MKAASVLAKAQADAKRQALELAFAQQLRAAGISFEREVRGAPSGVAWSDQLGPNAMKLELTKEWCMNMAKAEEGCNVDAGMPVMGGRESVDEALEVVDSFGPGTAGLNDTYARQILLAEEVRKLRAMVGACGCRIGECESKPVGCRMSVEIRLRDALLLADSEGTRAVQYLRRARKAEAALLALANAADGVGVRHFDSDWLSDEVQAMKDATLHARDVLGPNVGAKLRAACGPST